MHFPFSTTLFLSSFITSSLSQLNSPTTSSSTTQFTTIPSTLPRLGEPCDRDSNRQRCASGLFCGNHPADDPVCMHANGTSHAPCKSYCQTLIRVFCDRRPIIEGCPGTMNTTIVTVVKTKGATPTLKELPTLITAGTTKSATFTTTPRLLGAGDMCWPNYTENKCAPGLFCFTKGNCNNCPTCGACPKFCQPATKSKLPTSTPRTPTMTQSPVLQLGEGCSILQSSAQCTKHLTCRTPPCPSGGMCQAYCRPARLQPRGGSCEYDNDCRGRLVCRLEKCNNPLGGVCAGVKFCEFPKSEEEKRSLSPSSESPPRELGASCNGPNDICAKDLVCRFRNKCDNPLAGVCARFCLHPKQQPSSQAGPSTPYSMRPSPLPVTSERPRTCNRRFKSRYHGCPLDEICVDDMRYPGFDDGSHAGICVKYVLIHDIT
jgi:hypothetical protein